MGLLSKENDENKIIYIPLIKIRPNKMQPRKAFNEDELNSLSQSISQNGILQPLTVRKISNDEYELVAGERRLRASAIAGLKKVPCRIIKCSEKESAVFALIENLQRADLSIFEQARGIARLIRKYGITQQQAAMQLGKKQSTIANKLRLLKLSFDEQEWIEQAGLSERHARALLRIDDEELRKEALSKIIADNLNVVKSEDLISTLLMQSSVKHNNQEKRFVIKDVRIFINTINKAVDTMRLSGINAISKRRDTENYIEFTVKIPRENAVQMQESTKVSSLSNRLRKRTS